MDIFLIKKPRVTEKSADLSRLNQYTFEVDGRATKNEVKKMVQKIYNVHVVGVSVVNMKAKIGRYGRVATIKRPPIRKALVTIRKGESIDIMPR